MAPQPNLALGLLSLLLQVSLPSADFHQLLYFKSSYHLCPLHLTIFLCAFQLVRSLLLMYPFSASRTRTFLEVSLVASLKSVSTHSLGNFITYLNMTVLTIPKTCTIHIQTPSRLGSAQICLEISPHVWALLGLCLFLESAVCISRLVTLTTTKCTNTAAPAPYVLWLRAVATRSFDLLL